MLLRGHRASLETGWAAEETDKEEGHPAKWLKQALFTGIRECQPRHPQTHRNGAGRPPLKWTC